jgi:uncharacterized phage protein (TIGR02218 family)
MKSVSGALATHISGESLTLATLWRIVRRDAQVFRFTDHDRDIVYGGETYVAALGYQRAAIGSGADLAVDETELLGMLNSASIRESDLRAGLWDGASVRIFAVNFASPADGELKLRRGTLGEVVLDDRGIFRAELRGLAQPLQQTIGAVYQPECRADLGDARCGVNLALGGGFTAQDTIATVTDAVTLVLTGTGTSLLGDGWFDGGVAIWQTGANAGVAREVIGWVQSSLTLTLLAPPPFAPGVGDTINIQSGCDKRWVTCRLKFSNQLNFRGEPLVPGANAILETPA